MQSHEQLDNRHAMIVKQQCTLSPVFLPLSSGAAVIRDNREIICGFVIQEQIATQLSLSCGYLRMPGSACLTVLGLIKCLR